MTRCSGAVDELNNTFLSPPHLVTSDTAPLQVFLMIFSNGIWDSKRSVKRLLCRNTLSLPLLCLAGTLFRLSGLLPPPLAEQRQTSVTEYSITMLHSSSASPLFPAVLSLIVSSGMSSPTPLSSSRASTQHTHKCTSSCLWLSCSTLSLPGTGWRG